jgi:small subunit ribosomal protein S15
MSKISLRKKSEKRDIINCFSMHSTDCGSITVQIALLKKRAHDLQEHCNNNPKDFAAIRILKQIAQRIKRFNKYNQNTTQ